MKYSVIENYLENPLKIYDGCEPRKIIYKIKIKKKVYKIDLWVSISDWDMQIENKEELNKINDILELPKSNFMEKEIIVTNKINNEQVSVNFSRYPENKSFIIVYALFEKQPARYQCYILAVLEEKEEAFTAPNQT